MKLFTIAVVGIGLMACACPSSAQDEQKLRRDPTYSTSNYKHANKAAAARRWEANAGVAVQQPAPGDANVANYKRQVPNQQPVGGVTVEHRPDTDVANRNYKMQRPTPSPSGSSAGNSGIARKAPARSDKAPVSGE